MLSQEHGDPSEDAAVATVVFLLDGKLVVLRPSMRTEPPTGDLKYDMRVLSDKIEFFLILMNRGDEALAPTLKGSIWGWDGKNFNVWLPPQSPRGQREPPVIVPLDFYPSTVISMYGIITGLNSQSSNQRSLGFTSFKIKSSVYLRGFTLTDLLLESTFYSPNSSTIA